MWETILIIVVSLAAGFALAMALRKRARFAIVALEPLSFNMPSKDPKKAVKLTSEKIWFVNKGQIDVKNIEMTCKRRPAGFYFKPEVGYEESNLSNGGWKISVPLLKSGETLELLLLNAPARKKFRYRGGNRIPQEPILFPIASNRVIKGTIILATLGIISLLYILAKTLIPQIAPYL